MNRFEDKAQKRKKKEIEDYYKKWAHRSFQKGVRDALVYLGKDLVVIVGFEVLAFVEMSIIDDQYSRQIISYTKKKIVDKNYAVLKKNIEVIMDRKIKEYYFDISIDRNSSCLTFILEKKEK